MQTNSKGVSLSLLFVLTYACLSIADLYDDLGCPKKLAFGEKVSVQPYSKDLSKYVKCFGDGRYTIEQCRRGLIYNPLTRSCTTANVLYERFNLLLRSMVQRNGYVRSDSPYSNAITPGRRINKRQPPGPPPFGGPFGPPGPLPFGGPFGPPGPPPFDGPFGPPPPFGGPLGPPGPPPFGGPLGPPGPPPFGGPLGPPGPFGPPGLPPGPPPFGGPFGPFGPPGPPPPPGFPFGLPPPPPPFFLGKRRFPPFGPRRPPLRPRGRVLDGSFV